MIFFCPYPQTLHLYTHTNTHIKNTDLFVGRKHRLLTDDVGLLRTETFMNFTSLYLFGLVLHTVILLYSILFLVLSVTKVLV